MIIEPIGELVRQIYDNCKQKPNLCKEKCINKDLYGRCIIQSIEENANQIRYKV